jgi:hypothetical protein
MLSRTGMGVHKNFIWALSIAALLGAGCASGVVGEDSGVGSDDGGRRDGGRRDAGRDSGTRDSGPMDADVPDPDGGGPDCGGMRCAPFQYCDSGICRDYPGCAGDGTCPRPTDVCENRRCVPGDVDIDGDGVPAAEDCDETNPDRFPGNTEVCSPIDENCDGAVDEGDPATLCESSADGGECMAHVCGCLPGRFDVDRSMPGCECMAAPSIDQGTACDAAIDLGDIADTGAMLSVSGNAMGAGRDVWYRFRGVDGADTSCDNYHVRAQFLTNPDDTFELTVYRGACNTAACDESGVTDFRWATDFRATVAARLAGQCPCYASGAASTTDTSVCENDTAEYFVRVRRRASAAVDCRQYTLELSNGLYDTL